MHSGPAGRGYYNFFFNPNAIDFGILESREVGARKLRALVRVENLRLRALKRLPGASEEPSFLDFFSEPMVDFPQDE